MFLNFAAAHQVTGICITKWVQMACRLFWANAVILYVGNFVSTPMYWILTYQCILQLRLSAKGGDSYLDNRYLWWEELALGGIISENVTVEAISYYTKNGNGFIEIEFYTGESEYTAGVVIFLWLIDTVSICSVCIIAFHSSYDHIGV